MSTYAAAEFTPDTFLRRDELSPPPPSAAAMMASERALRSRVSCRRRRRAACAILAARSASLSTGSAPTVAAALAPCSCFRAPTPAPHGTLDEACRVAWIRFARRVLAAETAIATGAAQERGPTALSLTFKGREGKRPDVSDTTCAGVRLSHSSAGKCHRDESFSGGAATRCGAPSSKASGKKNFTCAVPVPRVAACLHAAPRGRLANRRGDSPDPPGK